MKKLALLFSAVIGLTLLILSVATILVMADTFGPHEVVFLGVSYDMPEEGQSTWAYSITSGSGPALSHLTLGVCLPTEVISASEPYEIIDPDPTTGIAGIKFEAGWEDGETRELSFVLAGNWEVADVLIGLKAGKDIYTGIIQGPSCEPTAVTLTSLRTKALCPKEATVKPAITGLWLILGLAIVGLAVTLIMAKR